MTRKITLRLSRLLATVALASAASIATPFVSPASATSAPTAFLTCSAGRVTTSMPIVQASQQYQPRYYAELYRYSASTGWQHVSWSSMWVTQTHSNDPNPGSTWGYAGPTWYPTGVGAGSTSLYFNVTPGYYYAIKNWTSDSNWQFENWQTAWASRSGLTYCRA